MRGQHRLHIDPRRRQQRLGERRAPAANGAGASQARPVLGDDRRTSEKPFECTPEEATPSRTSPGVDIAARQQRAALGRADGKAGEIVVARRVKARHFRRLAADQRRAGLPAALGDAGDDGARHREIELAGGEIIEEEQRLGALHDQVVDAHGDEVDADGLVPPGLDGDLDLGADAVVGGDQHRVAKAGRLQVEQRAEAAEIGACARPRRRPGQRLDRLDKRIARIDVDAGLGIGQRARPRLAGFASCAVLSPFALRHERRPPGASTLSLRSIPFLRYERRNG